MQTEIQEKFMLPGEKQLSLQLFGHFLSDPGVCTGGEGGERAKVSSWEAKKLLKGLIGNQNLLKSDLWSRNV